MYELLISYLYSRHHIPLRFLCLVGSPEMTEGVVPLWPLLWKQPA